MQLFLIGFMGSGKSTTGRIIARELSVPFVDSDRWLEQQEGKSVSEIFAEMGEAYFRVLERSFITSLADIPAVIACGGGLPCFHNLMEEMKQRGKVVYLEGSVSTLCARLKAERDHRPLLSTLTDSELEESVRGRLEAREEIYKGADLKVVIDGLSAEEVASAVINRLR